jgi:hypothetical protein
VLPATVGLWPPPHRTLVDFRMARNTSPIAAGDMPLRIPIAGIFNGDSPGNEFDLPLGRVLRGFAA